MSLRRESSGAHREMSTRSVLRRELSGRSVSARRNVNERQSMQRVIVKQGYLKKLPDTTKFGSAFKKPERRWFIFGVICNRDPYLEYFENEESIFTTTPLKMIFLDDCSTVTRNQKTNRFTNIFTLVLKKRQLSLIAQTRDSMLEWCRAIEDKLYSLGILGCVGGDNDYLIIPPVSIIRNRQSAVEPTALPQSSDETDISRDTYLSNPRVTDISDMYLSNPPIQTDISDMYVSNPRTQVLNGAGCSAEAEAQNEANAENAELYGSGFHMEDFDQACMSMPELMMTGQPTMRGSSLDYRPSRLSYLQPSENTYLVPVLPTEPPYLISLDNDSLPPPVPFRDSPSNSRSSRNPNNSTFLNLTNNGRINGNQYNATSRPTDGRTYDSDSDDEDIFVQVSTITSAARTETSLSTPITTLPSYSDSINNEATQFQVQLPVYSGRGESTVEASPSSLYMRYQEERQEEHVDGLVSRELPPPYLSPRLVERGANSPLKVTQVQNLKAEIDNPDGVTVVISRDQCRHSIALVDCFGKVWIAGWNQRSYSFLRAKLHIGDQLISVNGTPITSAKSGKMLIKDCDGMMDATLHLRRMPYASVFVLQRFSLEDDVGLEFVNGTSEVRNVDPAGMAGGGGLPSKCLTVNGRGTCNWWITEINHRPLNLFFSNDEARQGLKALGTYISFVAQPTQLIYEIKQELRKINEYKDYIVQ